MSSKRRFIFILLALVLVFVVSLVSWLQWSRWPDPKPMPSFVNADAIVILGGGDFNRWQQGVNLAKDHPELPLIVTGDDNQIVKFLSAHGISQERILHERMMDVRPL